MVGSRIAHYTIGRQVGSGGMGSVYEARDEESGNQVAIKVLRSEFAQNKEAITRFVNEAQTSNLIDHPGLVQIYESGQLPDGTAYLVMEFLDGETLSARLRRYGGPLPEMEVRRIGWQLASALAAAHRKSIIHRDLKPGNIMVIPDKGNPGSERVKLLDFGIAKLDVASLNLEDPQTRTGILMGTPHYMSPEQCRGAAKVDDRADVYSLGVILFQLLTGRLPFIPTEDGEGMVMAMHIYEQPPKPRSLVPTISEPMEQLVLDMLKKERADRPPMTVICSRLEELEGSLGIKVDLSVTLQESVPTNKLPQIKPSLGLREMATLISSTSLPSTFGSSTGQLASPAPTTPGSRRGLAVAGLGALIVAGVLVAGILWRRSPQPVTPKVPSPQVAATSRTPESPTSRHCELRSDPPGADVVRETDGQLLGKTPWQYEQPSGASPLILLLRRPGFGERALALDCQAGPTRSEKLDPLVNSQLRPQKGDRPAAGPARTKAKPKPKPKAKTKAKAKPKTKQLGGKKGGTKAPDGAVHKISVIE